ncbi:unnamed protein product [Pleuronectes platessa]|uniref:Uncharacterized protein n=1 Tax=Pleuronectes platessa TaxID=8262 RepID=A0A9N7Y2M7_PLEPL|nr:unnamed protein product [Pleuronectes platessa]
MMPGKAEGMPGCVVVSAAVVCPLQGANMKKRDGWRMGGGGEKPGEREMETNLEGDKQRVMRTEGREIRVESIFTVLPKPLGKFPKDGLKALAAQAKHEYHTAKHLQHVAVGISLEGMIIHNT